MRRAAVGLCTQYPFRIDSSHQPRLGPTDDRHKLAENLVVRFVEIARSSPINVFAFDSELDPRLRLCDFCF